MVSIIITLTIISYLLIILAAIVSVTTDTLLLDFFKPSRWKSFGSYLAKKYLIWAGEIKQGEEARVLTQSELIQFGYRFAKCYECILAGKCNNCGCDAVGRLNNKQDTCSAGKFGTFMDDKKLLSLIENGEFKDFKIEVNE